MVETYFVIRDHDCFDLGVSDLQIPPPTCIPTPKYENGTVAKTQMLERQLTWHAARFQLTIAVTDSPLQVVSFLPGITEDSWT